MFKHRYNYYVNCLILLVGYLAGDMTVVEVDLTVKAVGKLAVAAGELS